MSSFERAVEAIIAGDSATLASLLREASDLVRARSERPHHATLLHYVSANGVEDERQKSPPNSVEVARMLLEAGAEVDALADTYKRDDEQTTLNLVVSSVHPARAGVQVGLVDVLADFGAAVNGLADNGSPLRTALAFHYADAAAALVRRGARVDDIGKAAGVGDLDLVKRMYGDREAAAHALTIAAALGRYEVVDYLSSQPIDLGYQDEQGMTALHWAAWYGRLDMIDLLLSRNAPLDRVNNYGGTVLSQTFWCRENRHDVSFDWLPVIERLRR